ncbi:MAG: metallophosphoesterase [Patescibacteria group bacterium]|nr:metallophosphoesterase [Patescibacteria group bacterium]
MSTISRRSFVLASLAVLTIPRMARAAVASPVRFGMITDTHYADYESRDIRHYRESLGKMRECVDRLNEHELDFVIELGDFVDGSRRPAKEDAAEWLERIEAELARFKGPRYHVLGNHDMESFAKSEVLSHVENTGIEPTRSYYSFDHGGIHFVVLDANFRHDGEPYERYNFHWTDANVPEAELAWLKADLAAARGPIVGFSHQLFDGEGDAYVKNAAVVRKILESSGRTLAVFQGHHHAGKYSQIENVHYYTMKAMVEGSGTGNNAYAVVDIQPERIVIEGYQRAVGRTLAR